MRTANRREQGLRARLLGRMRLLLVLAMMALAMGYTWLQRQVVAAPGTGPLPILVITSSASTFGSYYAEILRNEGLNEFIVADLGSVTATTLASYDVVILAPTPGLSATQRDMLTTWVNGGGNLVAMRPDAQLATLLGIAPAAGGALAEGYLLVNTASPPGNGIYGQTMQYHGSADRYTLAGAAAVAALYSSATTATSNPAITLRSGIGTGAGNAAAFAYDLATSVVQTRQGNPAWATQERDGLPPIRSDDKFFGDSATDPRADWVDLSKVSVAQADEQMRLLANLVQHMNQASRPLPRFWYFPFGKKAVVIMTGDDHANGGTGGRFDQFIARSPAGCNVANWECVRGTSYVYTDTALTNAQAQTYNSAGFEVGLHISTRCEDFTAASLQTEYATQLAPWRSKYSGIPAPVTQRHHCIVWSDWVSAAQVQLANGMRLDTTYYYWPPAWVADVPGHFTGSAMPMRFAALNGSIVDVYHVVTQMTDESGQSFPFTIDTLLDRALGPLEQYGAYTVNAHTDAATSDVANAVVDSALARGVPIVTSRQMLTWLDARNSSSFGAMTWTGSALNFSVTRAPNANGLRGMLPLLFGGRTLAGLTLGGTSVPFTSMAVKGVEYAFFDAVTGTYVADYGPDTSAPAVSGSSPVASATNVDVFGSITATFSEAMDPTTINATTFTLQDGGGSPIAATVTYDSGTRTATLRPPAALAANTTYTATISGARDLAGNPVASTTWSFTTGAAAACPCSAWPATTVPGIAVWDEAIPLELGVKFRSDVSGFISAIRFYRGENATGNYVVNLWTLGGQQLATASVGSVSVGWQQVNFPSPVAITANTVYVASYFAPNGRYAADNDYFATSGVDRTPIHLLPGSTPGGNGVFVASGASSFPTQSFRSTNYWVDVSFTTSGGGGTDTTPPTVTATHPVQGATAVDTSTVVSATFSEAMDPASINANTFDLRIGSGSPIAATVTYDAGTRTATLRPAAALAANTTYAATLRGGATDPRAKDVAGNALAASATWTFTTGAASACPCSAWPATTVPGTAIDPETIPLEIGVKFRSDVSGFITGIRFYRGANDTGNYVVNLWTLGGQRLATANVGSVSVGWQQVNFPIPVAITANTVYVASYFAPEGQYAADTDYFATSGVDRPPIHLLQNGASGGNGVYTQASASSFPTQTFRSTNYWVDVSFTPDGGGGETTPPTVTGRSPATGATGVATSANVVVTFSEPMTTSTLNGTTILLSSAAGAVAATVTPGANNTATLDPTATLANSTLYTVTVKGGASGVKDAAGNAMTADVTWTFTTDGGGETTPPTVTGRSPATGATGVATSANVVVTFSEPMTTSTLNGTTILLSSAAGAVAATVTPGANNTATLDPTATLANSTLYTVTVKGGASGVKDAAGNAMTADVTWTFTTDGGGETTPPTVTGRSPATGATGVATSANVVVTFSEPMTTSTLNGTTILLSSAAGAVAATVTPGANNTATLDPTATLANSTLYTVTVKGGASGVKDAAGNAMTADVTWTFTTIAADTTPPTVLSNTPATGATGVARGTNVSVTFSERMDPATFSSTTFRLQGPQGAVAGAITLSTNGRTATLNPFVNLSPVTTYTATVQSGSSGVKDVAGNALATTRTWSFTTR